MPGNYSSINRTISATVSLTLNDAPLIKATSVDVSEYFSKYSIVSGLTLISLSFIPVSLMVINRPPFYGFDVLDDTVSFDVNNLRRAS
jgi:hypothetical protein